VPSSRAAGAFVGVVGTDTRAEAPASTHELALIGRIRAVALVCAIVALTALGVWLVSPRFSIDTPSLVDDWSAISRSPEQVHALLRLETPEEQRFRPSWILWNALQWHTFDAPDGFVGPNAWNLARMAVVVIGLCLLTLIAMPSPRTRVEAILQAALAAMPVLLLVTVPKFARDLARFGVQEPLLLGGLALGGSLLVLAVRVLLAAPRRPAWQAWVLGLSGAFFWAVGAYQKEASLSAVPLLAAALYAGRGRLASWRSLSRARRWGLGAIGLVFTLPLVHVAVETIRIAGRGDLVYETQVNGGRGILRGIGILYDWAHEVFWLQAQRVVVAAIVLVVITAVVRRRLDLLAVGALVSGGMTLVFAAQTNVAVSRYYLPAYALAAVALVLSLARLPTVAQVAGLVLLLAVVRTTISAAHNEVHVWVEEEDEGAALVHAVADAYATGCPVAAAGLDVETTEALPVLVDLQHRAAAPKCGGNATYLVVGPLPESNGLRKSCATAALEPVLEEYLASVYRCSRLRERSVRDPTFGLVAPERLVTLRRLRA
jgi:hypothetical protein